MSGRVLPLFPLNLVLYPYMPLPLHIFEERYKEMVQRCIDESKPFGVVLIADGDEVGASAVPNTIGTVARIQGASSLPEGKWNILTVGAERFRLLDYVDGAEPYLLGITEELRDEPSDPEEIAPLVEEVSGLFDSYFKILAAEAGVAMPEYELPQEAEARSFVFAAVMQIPLEQRQALLEMTDTQARLEFERDVLEQQLETIQSMNPADTRTAFVRKLDDFSQYFTPN